MIMRLASVLAVGFVFSLGIGNASADHDSYHIRDMSKIIIGETRQNDVVYGCMHKGAAIELARWIEGKPTFIQKRMSAKASKDEFLEFFTCGNFSSPSWHFEELLYRADSTKGKYVMSKNGKYYFATDDNSILKATSSMDATFFVLANQLVEGTPTEQDTTYSDYENK